MSQTTPQTSTVGQDNRPQPESPSVNWKGDLGWTEEDTKVAQEYAGWIEEFGAEVVNSLNLHDTLRHDTTGNIGSKPVSHDRCYLAQCLYDGGWSPEQILTVLKCDVRPSYLAQHILGRCEYDRSLTDGSSVTLRECRHIHQVGPDVATETLDRCEKAIIHHWNGDCSHVNVDLLMAFGPPTDDGAIPEVWRESV